MSKRSYGQNCALAIGLDVIGERWTLLIIRGLMTGPKRYSELLDQLRGMGTNLLAERLKSLVQHGIIEKGAGGDVRYSLTERGEALRPILLSLIRWGHQFRDLADEDAVSRPEWDMLAIEAAFRPERAEDVDVVIDLTLDKFRFHIVVDDESVQCVEGAAEDADVTASTNSSVLLDIGGGKTTIAKAVDRGDLELRGSRRSFGVLFKAFEL